MRDQQLIRRDVHLTPERFLGFILIVAPRQAAHRCWCSEVSDDDGREARDLTLRVQLEG
jgi:hypothetical protein